MKEVKINGLVVYAGPDEDARRYAGGILRQMSVEQARHGGNGSARVVAHLLDTAGKVERGESDRFNFYKATNEETDDRGEDLEMEITECSVCDGTGFIPGTEDYDVAVHRDNPTTSEPCGCRFFAGSAGPAAHAMMGQARPSSAPAARLVVDGEWIMTAPVERIRDEAAQCADRFFLLKDLPDSELIQWHHASVALYRGICTVARIGDHHIDITAVTAPVTGTAPDGRPTDADDYGQDLAHATMGQAQVADALAAQCPACLAEPERAECRPPWWPNWGSGPMPEPGMLGGADIAALIADKPHRCPDCYAGAATFRVWPLFGRTRRWVLHYCRSCRILWGGRRG